MAIAPRPDLLDLFQWLDAHDQPWPVQEILRDLQHERRPRAIAARWTSSFAGSSNASSASAGRRFTKACRPRATARRRPVALLPRGASRVRGWGARGGVPKRSRQRKDLIRARRCFAAGSEETKADSLAANLIASAEHGSVEWETILPVGGWLRMDPAGASGGLLEARSGPTMK